MTFTHEPITPVDFARIEQLNIMLGWKKPNARHWIVDRGTGDFLIWIAPDREPPHWMMFAFWWRDRLFGVELNDIKTHPVTGYCLEAMGIFESAAKSIPQEDWPDLGATLFDALQVYATVDASKMLQNLRESGQLTANTSDKLQATLHGFSQCPFATFRVDFPKEIQRTSLSIKLLPYAPRFPRTQANSFSVFRIDSRRTFNESLRYPSLGVIGEQSYYQTLSPG